MRRLVAGSLLVALALPLRAEAPRAATKNVSGPRVILVGWDGADWRFLDPLLQAGGLPNLAALLARGRSWNLESYQPMASPLLWTTIATGRTPIDHGVGDFQELDPKTRIRLPISGRSRRVPAIWNMASAKGLTVGVVGWWATWPAEKVNGFLVSDRSSPVLFDPDTLSKSPALTWPEGLADGVRILGRREGSPAYEDVAKGLAISRAEFDAAVAEQKGLTNPVTGYQKILGSSLVYARTALELYDRHKPRLLMVYFQGTDEIGHVLARYAPPRLPVVTDEEFRKYGGGVAAYYQEMDRILGELGKRAERDGAALLLVSDHGFKWGEERPRFYSSIQFDTAFLWHESPGILAASGPGILPSRERGKATIFDIAPTLCRLLGLPPDPGFEGKPVSGLDPRATRGVRAASWAEAAPVLRLAVAPPAASEKKAAEEFTKKLISLGYLTGAEAAAIDARPPDRVGTETSGTFQNFGTFLRARGEVQESIRYYEKALEVNPKSPSAWMNYSIALAGLGELDRSDEAIVHAAKNGYNDPEAALYRRVASYARRGEKEPRARAQLVSFLRRIVDEFPGNDRYRGSLGKVLFEEKDCEASEKIFAALSAKGPADLESLNLYALTVWCQGRTHEAHALFKKSLALDPSQEIVQRGLADIERGGSAPR